MARLFADAVNRHGGDAAVVHLPEIGIKGNTHFPFSDMNNQEIAVLLEKWLHDGVCAFIMALLPACFKSCLKLLPKFHVQRLPVQACNSLSP